MKPMLPTLSFDVPVGEEWRYEVKYDGFRAILEWDQNIMLSSRNGNPLDSLFPEIKNFLLSHEEIFRPFLPLTLDGEVVLLANPYKSNFGEVQVRGRMRSDERIHEQSSKKPCHLMIFDLLRLKGENMSNQPYDKRRNQLIALFQETGLPLDPQMDSDRLVQLVPSKSDFNSLWEKVTLFDGEGIVAKKQNSSWQEGKRTEAWLKYKNFKYVSCIITAYEKANGYFSIAVLKDSEPVQIGTVLFGFKPEEKSALFETIKQNKLSEDKRFLYAAPAICIEVKYLELYQGELREPHFHKFRFDLSPDACTFERFLQQQKNLPEDIQITHPDKPLWGEPLIQKMDYINYLRDISPYMLPFLKDRVLTVIRYPHGVVGGEAFYQKNRPDYAPDFVQTHVEEGIDYIVCNNLKTFLWLGNQIAIEYHIPFQTIHSKGPSEIVFDLDPPSKDAFQLAIKAALLIKTVLDQLNLISFIKTSGNKGLQIYIPLPENKFSYEDTRLFTEFVAQYLISSDPDSFTIERLKKNRGSRLYVDYIQHSAGKTIVAPFSPRGNPRATVAAPLFWDEVDETLSMERFQITSMVQRIKKDGNPFAEYFSAKEEQLFEPVLNFLKGQQSKV
ncbi:DNA ligase D [Mesobacillus harenae]|uniref:DNA ligase D n=1 Tax=Mesobacillus harenae TaxID=2213203 RepID=UPI001580DAC8